ncbi:EF-P lysine aminoacylase EpmA [Patescibacteria group bacterium]
MQYNTKNIKARAKILKTIREWFHKQKFIEVETPILVDYPDLSPNFNILSANITNLNKQKKYLITSPEFSMKKLLASELDKIFTITKVFRGKEENTNIHKTEFTMIEWYRKNMDYIDIMKDTENLINYLRLIKRKKSSTTYPRIKISYIFEKYARIKNVEKLSLSEFRKIIFAKNYSADKKLTYEQCFNLIFLNEIESKLPKTPFFLIDYPSELACLAKLKKNNPFIAERFELYINGVELCNGFSELTDGKEQLARFKKENVERQKINKPMLPIDYELCEKLNLINRAGGNAIGIDRLIMILLNANSIDEVMLI